jgi:prevent-host-death family protein
MVMKRTTRAAEPQAEYGVAATGTRRLGVAQAKARLSEVLRSLENGPVVIHARGHDLGVLMDIETFDRLGLHDAAIEGPGGASFLNAVEALKRRHGAVGGFNPKPANIRPLDPFKGRRR